MKALKDILNKKPVTMFQDAATQFLQDQRFTDTNSAIRITRHC